MEGKQATCSILGRGQQAQYEGLIYHTMLSWCVTLNLGCSGIQLKKIVVVIIPLALDFVGRLGGNGLEYYFFFPKGKVKSEK